MAIPQSVFPPLLSPVELQISPIIANGITNQFNQPKKGIKAINIPIADNIPISNPNVFNFLF